jgi:hypothetical protein
MNLLGAIDSGIYGYYIWKKLIRSPALPMKFVISFFRINKTLERLEYKEKKIKNR